MPVLIDSFELTFTSSLRDAALAGWLDYLSTFAQEQRLGLMGEIDPQTGKGAFLVVGTEKINPDHKPEEEGLGRGHVILRDVDEADREWVQKFCATAPHLQSCDVGAIRKVVNHAASQAS